jgi:rfaE bifunctional protein nucleotidyltransferase chain/domain
MTTPSRRASLTATGPPLIDVIECVSVRPIQSSGADVPSVSTVAQLRALMEQWRSQNQVIAVCQGCFDPVHLGHVLHFREVREQCHRLVVSVGADSYVGRGPGRPLLNEGLRARMVAELRVVDAVVINQAPCAVSMIEALRPDIFAKGFDYQSSSDEGLLAERAAIQKVGGRFLVTRAPKFSATALAQALDSWK